MLALLAHFSAGSWVTLIVLLMLGYAGMKLLPENREHMQVNKWICAAALLGIYLLLSQMLPLCAKYWPGKKGELVIPATLYLLGVYGCEKRPARVASVLLWIGAILLLPLILAVGKTVKLEWVKPEGMGASLWLIAAVLVPFLVSLATGVKTDGKWYTATGIAAVGIWIAVNGVLSPQVAKNAEEPFRHMSLSLSLGPYSRFESIGSIVITFGWYGFVSLCLHCANRFWEELGVRKEKRKWIHVILLLTILWVGARIAPEIMVAYLIVAWVLLPIFRLKKRSKKSEKSA